jgi:ubiquinol-cytochrome c reductase cytochrome c1 subunit
MRTLNRALGIAVMLAGAALAAPTWAADEAASAAGAKAEASKEEAERASDFKHWKAKNEVSNIASLQRGARNYLGYCSGCHSLKYMRYSRMAEDLEIPDEQLAEMMLPGDKPADYIISSMPAADATAWFGKVPPDLSLMVRARGGADHVYQFLKTFHADPTKPTGSNNLTLEGTAMPNVLSEVEGVKRAVYKEETKTGEDGKPHTERVFEKFELIVPGRLSEADYDAFVRDTVNFLDYASEPAQTKRRHLGVFVVLFLIAFTWLTMLLKKEYWKDVH